MLQHHFGTALTIDQARLIKKFTDNVIIAYDQDAAGTEATLRGIDILNENGLNVKILKLDREDVKDPDEYVNKYGFERLKNCISNSLSLVEFKVSKLEKDLDVNNVDSKIKFLNAVANILSKIDNNIEREIFTERISNKYNIGKEPIRKEIDRKLKKEKNTQTTYSNYDIKLKSVDVSVRKKIEQYIIALMILKDKNIYKRICENIDENTFKIKELKMLYFHIKEILQEKNLNKIDILSKIDNEEEIKELTDIMYIDISVNEKEKLLQDVLKQINKAKFFERRIEILERLKQDISKDEKDILQLELNQIMLQINKLK